MTLSPAQASAEPRDDIRARAFDLILTRSFFREKITLVSGRESDFYFDMKPVMFHPQGAGALGRLILARLAPLRVDYVGGLALGAVPLIASVAMASEVAARQVGGFFVRKEVKQHGTKRRIEGTARSETLAGKRVAILDDVTTTGGSAMLAVEAAREAGGEIVLVLSVVDREEGAAEFYAEQGLPFGSLFTAREFLTA